MIHEDDIRQVKTSADPVGVVSEHVTLKRVGKRWVGLCPFHTEKTPSFYVNPELGLWKCFGCGQGGDLIDFVQRIEHLEFVDAVEKLARRAGITLRYTTPDVTERRARRSELVNAVRKATEFYHERLLTSPDAQAARDYLLRRGIGADEIATWQIGWAPNGYDTLARHLKLNDNQWVDSGLGTIDDRGRQRDFFHARVMFPIRDVTGDPIGFGGRALPGQDQERKYVNSLGVDLPGENGSSWRFYAKERVLFGLDLAKQPITRQGRVVVCEGYTDVIGCHQAGIPEVVATCGTALTEEHVKVLGRYAREIVLAFDADKAGQAAAERLYGWEERHKVTFFVAVTPPGTDPADLARTNPDQLREAVRTAAPYLAWRLDRLLAVNSLSTPEQRRTVAEQALKFIAAHPSLLVRDQYTMQVAARLGLDPNSLRKVTPHQPRTVHIEPGHQEPGTTDTETAALSVAVNQWNQVAKVCRPWLFKNPAHRELLELFTVNRDITRVRDTAPAHLRDLLEQVCVHEDDPDPWGPFEPLIRRAAVEQLEEFRRAASLAFYIPTRQIRQALERLNGPGRVAAIYELLTLLEEFRSEDDSEPVVF